MDAKTAQAWEQVDDGLLDLMENNDEKTAPELTAKVKRLHHLSKFTERLAMRVSERLRDGTAPGSILELFSKYQAERGEIDQN